MLVTSFTKNLFVLFIYLHYSEIPTFKPQMQVKREFSEPASQLLQVSESPKWSPGMKALKAFAIWHWYWT